MKANASLLTPVAGTLVEANEALQSSPETINADPYGNGWLVMLRAAEWARDAAKLLDPQTYLSVIQLEAEQEIAG